MVINVSQIITLDKSFLQEKIARLPADHLVVFDQGLRLVLALRG